MDENISSSLPKLQSSFNQDSQLANMLFQRIMIRLKVHKVVKHWKKLYKNSFNRYKRIQEWVNTQKTYIEDIKIIINRIQNPLKQNSLINEQQDKILFPNLTAIIMLSEEMYNTMKSFLQSWHPIKTQIATAVIKLSNFFKIYIEYFNNFEKGKEILANIQEDKAYKLIEKSLKMDIASYLIKPVQRPLKYKLLLTDYQKKLRIDHPDYHALTKAIEIYHQVVQKTNEAIQNEKHVRRMIQMQSKFKNILESSRQWKFEFEGRFEDKLEICKVYVFTDLLLVIGNASSKSEQLICKMFLDATSFVQANEQLADDKNRVMFVSGKQQVGHFTFRTLQERNRIFEKLSKVINSLYVNEWKRKQQISKVESRIFSSARFSKPFYAEDFYGVYDQFNSLKKKFRVTVSGVQRRIVNKCWNSYFVIKLQLPFPQVINQKAFIKYEDLVDLESLLEASMNKWALVKSQNLQKIKWKTIQQLPKQLYKSDHIGVDSVCLQYRAKRIESFLNFILRNRETLKTSNLIFHKLKIFESIYERLIDSKYECELCEICQNGNIISNYDSYQEQIQKRLNDKSKRKEENFCIQRSFHTQNRLASQTKLKSRSTIDEILLYINSKLGIINQALTNRIIQGHPIKINIYRPYCRDIIVENIEIRQKYFELEIYKKDTVGNILEMIRNHLGLYGVKDYALYLVSNMQHTPKLLHQDQYVMDIIRENSLHIESQSRSLISGTSSGIKGFFSKIKQQFETKENQFSKLPSTRIQFRKAYKFPQDIETFTCAHDPVRYQIIVEEIFYQFKKKTINLHHTNIVKLCSLFICIQWNTRFPQMNKQEISKHMISQLIPHSRLHLVNQNFLKQIWSILQIYKQNKIRERTIFQSQVIELVKDNPSWNMQFFVVENLFPSISLNNKYLGIGINWQELYIVQQNNYLAPLVKIKLQNLNIKFSGFLVVVLSEERQYRLMCDDAFMLKCVLEKYDAFNRYFLGKDKMASRPIMGQSF